jgi:hypothetical protein
MTSQDDPLWAAKRMPGAADTIGMYAATSVSCWMRYITRTAGVPAVSVDMMAMALQVALVLAAVRALLARTRTVDVRRLFTIHPEVTISMMVARVSSGTSSAWRVKPAVLRRC